jgi:hypothetical protein
MQTNLKEKVETRLALPAVHNLKLTVFLLYKCISRCMSCPSYLFSLVFPTDVVLSIILHLNKMSCRVIYGWHFVNLRVIWIRAENMKNIKCAYIKQFITFTHSFVFCLFGFQEDKAPSQIWIAVNFSILFCLATCLVLFLCESNSVPKYSMDEKLFLVLVTADTLLSIYFLWIVMAFIWKS